MDKKFILTTIANNVQTLMNKAGLSSAELARRSKISTGTISKILKGSMSITLPMAVALAQGLGVDLGNLLSGLASEIKLKAAPEKKQKTLNDGLAIGVLSIDNKRITCIKDGVGQIIGSSELEGGLDLAETSSVLLRLIEESIFAAATNKTDIHKKLKTANINLVTQSYEFEDTRLKFSNFAKRHFKDVLLMPDWQITYFAAFQKQKGISLIVDKGVSLSYKANGVLKKLGGWKFPVYDLGGENWLGVETIRHTIEAVEGYIPMSQLAQNVMAKYGGKIEKLTETCFKNNDADIYCIFTDLLIRNYLLGEVAAKSIIENGFDAIARLIKRVDEIVGKELKICLNGSLTDIYKPFFQKNRLLNAPSNAEKASLLAEIDEEFLYQQNII